jgi:hypothetical protein
MGLMMSGPLIDWIGFGGTISLYSLIGLLGVLSMTRIWRDQLWSKSAPANQTQVM